MQNLIQFFSVWWILLVSLLVTGVIVHRLIFTVSKMVLKPHSPYQFILKEVELPALLLLLFISVFAFIDFTSVPQPYCDGAFFSTEFFLLLSIAWFVLRFFKGALEAQIHQLKEKNDRIKRAHVTQLSFAYKVMSFVALVFIVGAIFLISPGLKTLGVGLLGSAGIAGIALGVAAQPLLLNFMSGFQLVLNKTLNIGDAVFICGDYCTVEEIKTTQAILRTWDGRRHIYPISKFVQEPYQNWDLKDASKIGRVSIFCDYSVDVKELRKKYESYISTEPLYNGQVASLFVMNATEKTIEIVCQLSANSPPELFQLKCKVREEMIRYIQQQHPGALPQLRLKKDP